MDPIFQAQAKKLGNPANFE